MERNLNILLVEDDVDACTRFKAYVDITPGISLVDVTNNSYHALELVNQLHPDVVILDLELNYGKGNGLQFLHSLKTTDIPFKPYVLITTNNSSNITYDYARQYGADFIMAKHQEDYSEAHVIDFLIMIKESIQKSINKQNLICKAPEPAIQYEKHTKKRIAMELDKVGISPKANGYQYLIDTIFLLVTDQDNNIYTTVGQMHSKTASSVERAMQNAINKAWCTTDIDDLLCNYTAKISPEKGIPTLTEFLYYYMHRIKNGH